MKEVVERGTGVKAQYPGLEVGGKTGTAHIAKNGRYVREYHSSFYGFANDKEGHKYTIGVLVIRAKKYRKYFASQSAVPTFRRTLDILVELYDYLKPEGDVEVSPEIVIDKPETSPVAVQQSTQVAKSEEKKEVLVSKPKPSTVNELFNVTPTKTETKTVSTPPKKVIETKPKTSNPPEQKSVNELFEDLF